MKHLLPPSIPCLTPSVYCKIKGWAEASYRGSSKQRVEIAVIFKLSSHHAGAAPRDTLGQIFISPNICVLFLPLTCRFLSRWSNDLIQAPSLYLFVHFQVLNIPFLIIKKQFFSISLILRMCKCPISLNFPKSEVQ